MNGGHGTRLELAAAYESTLEGWARALDLRDRETEGHSRRVTDLTVRLARLMGISEADCVHLRRGALLHHIGKMGILDFEPLQAARRDVVLSVLMRLRRFNHADGAMYSLYTQEKNMSQTSLTDLLGLTSSPVAITFVDAAPTE